MPTQAQAHQNARDAVTAEKGRRLAAVLRNDIDPGAKANKEWVYLFNNDPELKHEIASDPVFRALVNAFIEGRHPEGRAINAGVHTDLYKPISISAAQGFVIGGKSGAKDAGKNILLSILAALFRR